ncbi:hypothetical protein L7F22_026294 [Adiantum nelumboides]|nr:hypothetical protein [Adiantum nelumboides]
MQMDDSVKWEQAMQSEYNLIVANETWDIVELPPDKNALPCKWDCTSSSTIEAEDVAASDASKEAIWLARLVGDLGIHQVPVLNCDSQSGIALENNPVFHSKSKHIEVRYHVIRDVLTGKRIELVKVHTDDNPADALTKSLALEQFAHCIELMGVG